MTKQLEEILRDSLLTVCPRVFPDEAPDGTERPYVVYHQYGGTPVTFVEGASADKRNGFVQINVWSDSRIVSNDISRHIEEVLVSSQTMQAVPLNELSYAFDDRTKLRGSMQDFSIWTERI